MLDPNELRWPWGLGYGVLISVLIALGLLLWYSYAFPPEG